MRTAEEVRDYLKKRKEKRGSKKPWISFKEGTYFIRIGPPWKKKGEVWKDVLFHGGWKNKVYCAKNDIDKETGKQRKCAVCRRVAELKTDRSERGKVLWKLIVQKSEGLWNVLVAKKVKKVGANKYVAKGYVDNKFKIHRASYGRHNQLVDIFSDDDFRERSILGVTHPKYGRLIRMKREGSGRDDTVYTFKVLELEGPISKDEEKREKILGTLQNLDKVVNGSSDEELRAFLRKMEKKAKIKVREAEEDEEDGDEDDVDDEEEEEEEEEEEKRHSKRHSRDHDESDEDEDEDEEEGDEEEEDEDDLKAQYRTMKKKLKKKKRREEEEEDDNEDEED